ncbi:LD-carboxypeptidase [Inquilinus sp. CAU 1745]|uniref:S66 peptidase family protein n=1 Tax=Inquilinus sp. CAU 1745 TaxID=3140369 RepID=UPI00325A5D29
MRLLCSGDTIGLIAPADWTPDDLLEAGEARLQALGYRTRRHAGLTGRKGRLAGPDEMRRRAVEEGFADPEMAALLCVAGGYGSGRLLGSLDYGLIGRNPKPLVGYSDITALLIAIHAETGMETFHGPVLKEIAKGEVPVGERALLALLEGRFPAAEIASLNRAARPIVAGEATGRLIGGNLTLLHSLVGTPWMPKDLTGRILFVEDWREPLYHLDRMLFHLRQTGLFEGLAGLIVGRIAEIDERPAGLGGDIDHLLAEHFADAPYPVATNAAIGHAQDKATLPIGRRVTMRIGDEGLTLAD